MFKLPIFAMLLCLNVNIYDFRAVHEKKYVGHTYLNAIEISYRELSMFLYDLIKQCFVSQMSSFDIQ